MAEIDPHDLVSSLDGAGPTPEFIATLEAHLIAELETPWVPRVDTSDGDEDLPPFDVNPVEDPADPPPRRRLVLLAVAAAVVVLVVIGLVAVVPGGDAETPIDTVDRPDGTPAETTRPSTPPVPFPEFDFTVIEVGSLDAFSFADGRMWAGETGTNSIARIDVATGATLATIELPAPLLGIARDDTDLWVIHDDAITRIDRATDTVVATVDLAAGVTDAPETDDDFWYRVNTEPGVRVFRINRNNGAVTAIVDVDVERAAVVRAGADAVWLGDTGDTERVIVRIDPTANGVAAVIDRAPFGGGFAVGPDAVWAGEITDIEGELWRGVTRIDPASNSVSEMIPVAPFDPDVPWSGGIHVTGGSVWVRHNRCPDGEECRNALTRIDPTTNTVVAVRDLPPDLDDVGMGFSDDALWITGDGVVARVDFSPDPE